MTDLRAVRGPVHDLPTRSKIPDQRAPPAQSPTRWSPIKLDAAGVDAAATLGIGLVISIVTRAVERVQRGSATCLTAINIAYDEEETRGFVKQRAAVPAA